MQFADEFIHHQLLAGRLVQLDFAGVGRLLSVFFKFAIGQSLCDIKNQIELLETSLSCTHAATC
ncbi:hypothetical protein LC605_22915 [Nostoc sp. CHAB 5836]|uniref:hypothetical protein n=1 Tax=Nostoc sp. CHAB 5836 TaxID=2780404 RepID=UPI001E2AE54C|nr:hypothetical protein [Nostoc sp. CHAB 5836]MCC5617882.1 hypothetical protein [Nostoc sp. CHAB 5836]